MTYFLLPTYHNIIFEGPQLTIKFFIYLQQLFIFGSGGFHFLPELNGDSEVTDTIPYFEFPPFILLWFLGRM